MTASRLVVVAFLLASCELPDKEVGLDPEPPSPLPEVCVPSCEQRTGCMGADAYACLGACRDDFATADSHACHDAKIALYECRQTLTCDELRESLDNAAPAPCSEEFSDEWAQCG